MSQKLTILFDLDGTLVNTAPDLMLAHNHVMKKYGYNERQLSDIKKLAGKGSKTMLTRSIHEIAELSGKIKKTDESLEKMTKEFILTLDPIFTFEPITTNGSIITFFPILVSFDRYTVSASIIFTPCFINFILNFF